MKIMPKKKAQESNIVEVASDMLEKKICGIRVSAIRKAYFGKKIPQLLAEIMSNERIEENDLKEVAYFLAKLRDEELIVAEEIRKEVPSIELIDDPKPPTVKQLSSDMSPKEKEQFAQWEKEKDWALDTTKKIMRQVAKDLIQKAKIPKQQFMDYAHELVGLIGYINEDRVWKEQLYMKRLTDMIDSYGISRREAEDRSKVTSEYAEYKTSVKLLEQIDNFIMNCKKEYGGDQFK